LTPLRLKRAGVAEVLRPGGLDAALLRDMGDLELEVHLISDDLSALLAA